MDKDGIEKKDGEGPVGKNPDKRNIVITQSPRCLLENIPFDFIYFSAK